MKVIKEESDGQEILGVGYNLYHLIHNIYKD